MLQASNENFLKRRIELEVLYGQKINAINETTESLAKPLYEYLKATKEIEVHLDFCLSLCAICEQPWKTGDFAKEKMLLIPKPSERSSERAKPVRVTIPRVVCPSCSQTLGQEDGVERKEGSTACTFLEAWNMLLDKTKPKVKIFVSPTYKIENPLTSFKQTSSQNRDKCANGSHRSAIPTPTPAIRPYENAERQNRSSQQQQPETTENRQGENSGSVTPTSENNSSSSGGESQQSMVDQKGFLLCVSLVKSGGADLAGLKAGDIFIQFGNITKENFEGLKSVANFVRARPNQPFQVVVFRRVGASNNRKKRGATFQKVRLDLTPLYCHEAEGGGVLGAVMNVYPLPTSDVQNPGVIKDSK